MVGVVALWLVAAAAASADRRRPSLSADNLVYADNGVIKVGMSLDRGGSIAFLVRAFLLSYLVLSCMSDRWPWLSVSVTVTRTQLPKLQLLAACSE